VAHFQEASGAEMADVDGGVFWFAAIGVGLVVGGLALAAYGQYGIDVAGPKMTNFDVLKSLGTPVPGQ
jgi:hypothetical protein